MPIRQVNERQRAIPEAGSVATRWSRLFEGALWARFELRRVADEADAIGVPGGKAAGQRPVCSHERSCRQRTALDAQIAGVFPMTHNVECAAPVWVA